MAEQFDLVVIGGGNGGYIPAIRASQLGMSVALIEKREGGHLGGTCLNLGCIPTKALLQTAHLLHDARNGEEYGVKVGEVEFDYPQAAKRREQVVTQLRRGVQGLMKKNKVTVYNGVGSFVEPKKIKVRDRRRRGGARGGERPDLHRLRRKHPARPGVRRGEGHLLRRHRHQRRELPGVA